MKVLKSHPNLLLRDHVAQVKEAMEGIWEWHSKNLISERVKWLSLKLASLHDAGKGSTFFQGFINDPSNYTGDSLEKAHTPLSLVLTLLCAKQYGWDPLDSLALAASVYGHHSGLPSLASSKFGEDQNLSRTLDDFASGPIAKALKKQAPTLDLALFKVETGINLARSYITEKDIREMESFLEDEIMPVFYAMSLQDALNFRLRAQLIFSMLLEADRAFLAVPNARDLLKRRPRKWKSIWVEQKIGKCKDNHVNLIRKQARAEVIENAINDKKSKIYSMTAPTGIGKTLLGATWALMKREFIEKETRVPPKIIVVMPYLSIIEQTAKEYKSLLELGGHDVDGSWFLTSHSLSERKYDPDLEGSAEYFFIDTWRTELVITTYDQFLSSLVDPRTKYQMRFHNLCDALIIMDEVQSLPCKLWKLLDALFQSLSEKGNSQILLMSATLPSFVSDAKPLLTNYAKYFKSFSRYELRLNIKEKLHIQAFCEDLGSRLEDWLRREERVLVTLNTRKSARTVYDYLRSHWPEEHKSTPLLFLSADVTPKDRLEKIDIIKTNQPCIVVSTQCIEAGVDIDMGIVIRDFAPWDSIVQIAGRCNREGNRGRWLPVEIVDLVDENNQRYSAMIYDEISLHVTRNLLETVCVIKEEDVLDISNRYFEELEKLKDTGKEYLERFARWQENVPIRELLRGKDREQYPFLVIQQDPSLKKAMREANDIDDRWKRREAWRSLAGRIARISVSIFARSGFSPEQIASEYLGHWILREGYYDSDRGINLEGEFRDIREDTLIF
mgnify:CR=1 FL=1